VVVVVVVVVTVVVIVMTVNASFGRAMMAAAVRTQ
jgi:hypothetical protein